MAARHPGAVAASVLSSRDLPAARAWRVEGCEDADHPGLALA
jgi:hypothetical protein